MKMRKIAILLVVASILSQCLAGCSADPADLQQGIAEMESDLQSEPNRGSQVGDYKARAEELSTFMLENLGVTTVQYALMDGDEIVLSNMVGVNDDWNKPVFCIASSSKMYVTAAIMMLVDQGKIDLDTPVVQYIPEFIMADERYMEITPHMLLNHSSGLYGTNISYGNSMTLGEPSTIGRDVFFENKKNESLKANPGEIAVYCNDGFVLSEFLVEKVSGMTYTAFIEENIVKPLGLKYTTTAFGPGLKQEDIAVGLGVNGEPMPVEYMNYPGTGGIYSTTEEMCKFARLFMGAYPEILSKESAELTMEKEYLKGLWVSEDTNTMLGYGLGWDDVTVPPFTEYGIRALNKGGDASFHHADLTVLPDHNISMAVLTSGGASGQNAMLSSRIILEYLVSKGIIKEADLQDELEPTAPVKVDMPEELKKYEGLYGSGTSFARTVQITIDEGELFIPGGFGGMIPDMTFVYTGNNEFTSEDGTTVTYFKEEANGNTYAIQKTNMVVPGFGSSVVEGFQLQRLELQQLSEGVKAAWQTRVDKQYMCVNEIYNSTNYCEKMMLVYSPVINLENGYADADKIIDENRAVSVVQMPVMGGRDSYDMSFYSNDGKSYLNKNNQIFISSDHIAPFNLSDKSSIVIGTEGYAEWFSIDAGTAGKEVTITIPAKSSVFVYDQDMALSAYFIDLGVQTLTIPSGGFIIFAGSAGAEFKLA